MEYRPRTPEGLKPKDLIGVPWRVALALQQDGWYLRSDIIWYKPNTQPESVKDRPTRAHEYLFLLTKEAKYFYNYEESREPTNGGGSFRNRRSVWSIPTETNHPSHLAVFPPELVSICVRSSTKTDDIVLDPFMGSGTVGLVCKNTNRKFIGIEIKPEYADLSRRRIQDNGSSNDK
jgi:DNA modification methylase